MGTKNNPSKFDCYNVAAPDEPLFTLRAHDRSAPWMVRQWAYEREREIRAGEKPESDMAMVEEARACARDMERWRADHRAHRIAEGHDG